MKQKLTIPQMARLSIGLKKIINDQPRTAGAKAVVFFKGNFRRQGFPMNGRLEKWPQRKQPDYRKGGALLVHKGRLRRSIRTMAMTPRSVTVGTSVPYAEIHNEGGNITGTARVPEHTRKEHNVRAHTRRGPNGAQQVPGHRRKAAQVEAHTRQMNITMKQRKFIGHSPDLMKSIEREYLRQVRALEQQIFM